MYRFLPAVLHFFLYNQDEVETLQFFFPLETKVRLRFC